MLLTASLTAFPLAAALADSGAAVLVRTGTHDGYGRVVFDLPPHTQYSLTRDGDRVLIKFSGDLSVGSPQARPRNVADITGGASQAELVVVPGAALRDFRVGDRMVIDVLDRGAGGDAGIPQRSPSKPPAGKPTAVEPQPQQQPPSAPAAAAAPAPAEPPPQPPPERPTASQRVEPVSTPAEPTAAPPPLPAPTEATQPEPSPAAHPHSATPTTAVVDTQDQSAATADPVLVLPSDAQLGIAAFRRGNVALIVLDQGRSIDTAPLRDDPVFGTATVQTLPTATVIRVPLGASMALSPAHSPEGWRITAVSPEPSLRPIQATVTDDRLTLPATSPGSVVSVVDPDTGAVLLVGTQRREGQGVPVQRRASEFTLLPTWIGVAVEPSADLVALRATLQGFVLDGSPGGLAVSPPSDIADQLAHAAGLTRQFDFPSQPTSIAVQRLQRQIAEGAATPPLARAPQRQEVARTMIALGLGAEAQAVLHLAASDDPHEAASSDNAALTSIAALLARRPTEADALADPRIQPADDVTLWRAVRLAQVQEDSAAAAAMFASTLPLLLAYPSELRSRVLPLAAETLVAGGETATAAALLAARKDDDTLDLARAMLQEAKGDTADALAIYDRLTQSRDQSTHARAAVRAVELRLAKGTISEKQAADQLESLLYAWRGDRHERALRERLAELKTGIGAWRSALALLRENETLFPQDKASIHRQLTDMFAALLHGNTADTLSPLELVAVVEENADLLPTGPEGDAMQGRLADRLLALDLPKRAGPVLEKLMQTGNSATARAGFGARLAALRLREADAPGALAALDASTAPELPAELAERRTLLVAAANARRGDGDGALAALGSLDSAAADEARATILERNNDWPAAQRALTDYAAKTVPAEGKLDDPQRRTLLRLATAAARAGDDGTLATLRRREAARMGSGPLANMFRLLTAEQVRSVADLKRSGQEAALAGALPGQLKALQPPARQTP